MYNIEKAIKIIAKWESYRANPYYCPAHKLTVGYGHVILKNDSIKFPISKENAIKLLYSDVSFFYSELVYLLKIRINNNQFCALLSLVYNIGSRQFQNSTIRAMVNRGDFKDAPNEFPKWCHSGGIRIAGLLNRRYDERKLFLEKL